MTAIVKSDRQSDRRAAADADNEDVTTRLPLDGLWFVGNPAVVDP